MCGCYSLFQITALVEEQSVFFFLKANCGAPTVPTNGSIGAYQNTTEGTVIMFGCDPGFVPAGNTTAVCASDGRWIPDPATLVCTCKLMCLLMCFRAFENNYNISLVFTDC